MERKKGSCQPKRGIIFAIAAVGLILGFAAPEIGAQAQKERAPSVEGATYVGSKNCEICHKEIYLKWNATLHRRKIQPADETTVVGDFYRNNLLTVERGGKKYISGCSKKGRSFSSRQLALRASCTLIKRSGSLEQPGSSAT